jgi:hypothetical protein
MFVLSGHIMIAMSIALGLLHSSPERNSPAKHNTLRVQLNAPESASLTPGPVNVTAPAATLAADPAALVSDPVSVTALDTPTNTIEAPPKSAPPETTETTETPILEAPYYYGLKQLSKKPEVIEDVTTTLSLFLPGIETQTAILRLLINERGEIDSVELEQSDLNADLIDIIKNAFRKLRFNPGEIDGLAVKCQLKIEVLLESADVPPLKQN